MARRLNELHDTKQDPVCVIQSVLLALFSNAVYFVRVRQLVHGHASADMMLVWTITFSGLVIVLLFAHPKQ